MGRASSCVGPEVAIVTGAGSGVGRACALLLLQKGWRVALVGRRREALDEARKAAGRYAGRCVVHPADITIPAAAPALATAVLARWGRLDALVNAAGTNIPRRSLRELSDEDYHRVLATNLHGPLQLSRALLPALRRSPNGTVININSEAGLRASAKSGAAYVTSKFALTGLAQTINAEEGPRGVRACSIFPGDIDTPLLELRPVPPPASARRHMLQPADIAECVWLALQLPRRALVEQLIIRPRT